MEIIVSVNESNSFLPDTLLPKHPASLLATGSNFLVEFVGT